MELVTMLSQHDLEPGDLGGQGGSRQSFEDDPSVRELPPHQELAEVQIGGDADPPFTPGELRDLLIADPGGVVAGESRETAATPWR
jgi:hypothetical protein